VKVTTEYDATIKRYTATVYNDAGAMVYKCVRAKREAAKWAAENYVACSEPLA
jgi:hypothetical protein